jgi:hypothetical protein
MDRNQWFTVYWLDGSKSHIYGETIDKAFAAAGYGGGSVNAVDWYDNGISNTHYRDQQKKEWVPFKNFEINKNDFLMKSMTDILNILKTSNSIQVKLENEDIVVLSHSWGLFHLNNETVWVEYIELTFGEYFKGTYSGDSDDEENSHHYMMANGQYFSPDDIAFSVEAFMQRVKKDSFYTVNTPHCKRLEEIHQSQKVKYVC